MPHIKSVYINGKCVSLQNVCLSIQIPVCEIDDITMGSVCVGGSECLSAYLLARIFSSLFAKLQRRIKTKYSRSQRHDCGAYIRHNLL